MDSMRTAGRRLSHRVDKQNIISGSLAIALSIAVYIFTLPFPSVMNAPSTPPPAFFPRLLSIGIGMLGVFLFVSGIAGKREKDRPSSTLRMRVLVGLGVTLAYIIIVPLMGFFATTCIYLCSLSIIIGERDWKIIGAIALFGPLLVYLLFVWFLEFRFPSGFLI